MPSVEERDQYLLELHAQLTSIHARRCRKPHSLKLNASFLEQTELPWLKRIFVDDSARYVLLFVYGTRGKLEFCD